MTGKAVKGSHFILDSMNVNYHNVTSVQENGLFVSLKNPAALRMKLEVVVPDNPVIVTNGLEKTKAIERRQGIPAPLSSGSPLLYSEWNCCQQVPQTW